MLGWAIVGIAALVTGGIALAKRHGLLPPSMEQEPKTLAQLAKSGDTVIVPILAVQPGFQSDTMIAELAAVKAANVAQGQAQLRIEDIVIDGPNTARGVINGTPFSPTTRARIQLTDIKGIERPNDKNPDGFDIIKA